MATSCSFIKYLRSTCEIVFYCVCWLKFCSLYMKKVVSRVGVLKNFLKFTDNHKKQSTGGVLSKHVLKILSKFTKKHPCQSLFFNKVAGWKPKTVRSSHCRCSVKQVVLKIFGNFMGKHLLWSLFLIKLQF